MAFCANCGAQVTDGAAFCAGCGKPASGSPQAVPMTQPLSVSASAAGAQSTVAINSQTAGTAMAPNLAGALAYILGFITGILFLVLEPYKRDRFVRFHAMQSILYSAAGIVFKIGWSILVSAVVDVAGWASLALVPVGLVISLGLFLFWLFLMYLAYNNRQFRIPIIGAIAAKQVG